MIIGLDLSLTATGFAALSADGCKLTTIEPKGVDGEARLDVILDALLSRIPMDAVVVIEGLSFGKALPSAFERAALHWMVRCELKRAKMRFFICPPTTLKLFVTGKGNAEKSMMLREVWKRWNVDAKDDNQADAAALAYLGACITGQMQPQNEAQRRAVASVLTPKVKARRKAA